MLSPHSTRTTFDMINWLKKASTNAQRGNVRRTLTTLVQTAEEVDSRILQNGSASPADQRRVTAIQKSLLGDLVGPVTLQDLKIEFMEPILSDHTLSDGTKLAVRHVFDTAERRGG